METAFYFSLSVTEFGSNLMSDGPLGFAPNEHREGGDIVKQDFIAGDGREGTKKLAAFSISLLFLSCLFNGIKVGIFASRWFGERERTF